MKIEQITKDHVLKFAKPAQDQTKVLNYLCHIILRKSVFIDRSYTKTGRLKSHVRKEQKQKQNPNFTLLYYFVLTFLLELFTCIDSGTITRLSSINCIITSTIHMNIYDWQLCLRITRTNPAYSGNSILKKISLCHRHM